MRSATTALLWEIWSRHRLVVAAMVGLTIAGRLLTSSLLVELLGMLSFLLLFGIFNGRFPRRLFTLPVSSLRLVLVPVAIGVVSVELLYLAWMGRLWRDGTASRPFVAVLLGALIVFYQCVLWTLELLGALRLVVVGLIAAIVVGIGLWPSFPPTPPPPWRSEAALAVLVALAAMAAFLLTWRHVARSRRGGGRVPLRLERLTATIPARRRGFSSGGDAHFWFEWRSSGLVLPILAGGVIVLILGPLSWLLRANAADSFRLLLGALLTPIVLAIPVGMAFAKPALWSEDLSIRPFVAVLPLTDEDLIAVKVKVAAVSAAVSWLLVLAFISVWLPLWANLDWVSRLAIQLWAFHGRSVAVVYGLAALIVIAGMLLTWRCLISRLWSGVSGKRPLFIASVLSVVVVVIAALAFDADRLPGWLLADSARMAPAVWIAAIAVIVKYWLAARSWRRVSARYARQYLLPWSVGTACLLLLAILLWRVMRIYVAADVYRLQSLMILLSLLAVPLMRVGLAPSYLRRNRHRS